MWRGGALVLSALLAACGGARAPYPVGAQVGFEIECVNRLWPGDPAAPLDEREAFCHCVLEQCARRWDVAQLDRIRAALQESGYRTDAQGVPPEFGRLMADCTGALDRGAVPVR